MSSDNPTLNDAAQSISVTPRRRFWTFSLRELILLTFAVCAIVGWYRGLPKHYGGTPLSRGFVTQEITKSTVGRVFEKEMAIKLMRSVGGESEVGGGKAGTSYIRQKEDFAFQPFFDPEYRVRDSKTIRGLADSLRAELTQRMSELGLTHHPNYYQENNSQTAGEGRYSFVLNYEQGTSRGFVQCEIKEERYGGSRLADIKSNDPSFIPYFSIEWRVWEWTEINDFQKPYAS